VRAVHTYQVRRPSGTRQILLAIAVVVACDGTSPHPPLINRELRPVLLELETYHVPLDAGSPTSSALPVTAKSPRTVAKGYACA